MYKSSPYNLEGKKSEFRFYIQPSKNKFTSHASYIKLAYFLILSIRFFLVDPGARVVRSFGLGPNTSFRSNLEGSDCYNRMSSDLAVCRP